MSEAGVHFDFYRHLQNTIDDTPQRGARTYERVEPEYSQDIDGRADLVVFDADGPMLVIEAKRPDGTSGREIDPYSPVVIRQAHRYASELGTPFFATYNGKRLVLFNTHEEGVPLLKRSTKSYDIGNVEAFADTLLDEIARLVNGVGNVVVEANTTDAIDTVAGVATHTNATGAQEIARLRVRNNTGTDFTSDDIGAHFAYEVTG